MTKIERSEWLARRIRNALGRHNDDQKGVEPLVEQVVATLDEAEDKLAERNRQIVQIILDDVGYTYDQLSEGAREKISAIRARGKG